MRICKIGDDSNFVFIFLRATLHNTACIQFPFTNIDVLKQLSADLVVDPLQWKSPYSMINDG